MNDIFLHIMYGYFFSLIVFSTFVYVMITTEYFLDSIEHLAIERWPILCVNEVQN